MIEILGTLLNNIPTAVVVAILLGLLRNVTGWLENSYGKEKKQTDQEIKEKKWIIKKC